MEASNQVAPLVIERMTPSDIPVVQSIEREIFTTPWPKSAYYRELASDKISYYIVLRRDNEIIGYAGMWRMYDEAHVTTIGVKASEQGKGYGRVLFATLVQAAYDSGVKWISLEVRTSNDRAIKMYEEFGLKVVGRRKGYYSDNNEDAIVMWSDSIYSPRFIECYKRNLERITYKIYGVDLKPPIVAKA